MEDSTEPEMSGQSVWRALRPQVVAMGPLKVIRRIADRCPEELVEKFDEQMLLVDDRSKAAGGFEQLVRPGRRLPKAFEATADSLALGLLDAWAEVGDDPGAEVSGLVVEALGKRVAHLEFDSGVPGSGQSLSAWRLGAQVFLVGRKWRLWDLREPRRGDYRVVRVRGRHLLSGTGA